MTPGFCNNRSAFESRNIARRLLLGMRRDRRTFCGCSCVIPGLGGLDVIFACVWHIMLKIVRRPEAFVPFNWTIKTQDAVSLT